MGLYGVWTGATRGVRLGMGMGVAGMGVNSITCHDRLMLVFYKIYERTSSVRGNARPGEATRRIGDVHTL